MRELVFSCCADESQLPKIAASVNDCIANRRFCLWLEGVIGAGKTTFTRHFLQTYGLPEDFPVTSPTYSYINDYEIRKRWFAHLDLYRAVKSSEIEDLGLLDNKDYFGVIAEWPETVDLADMIKPTHTLQISFLEDSEAAMAERRYDLYRYGDDDG